MTLYFSDHFHEYFKTFCFDYFLTDGLQNVVYFIFILTCVFELLILFFDGEEDVLHVFLKDETGFHGDDFEFGGCICFVFGGRGF